MPRRRFPSAALCHRPWEKKQLKLVNARAIRQILEHRQTLHYPCPHDDVDFNQAADQKADATCKLLDLYKTNAP